jgi:protein-S-isoprenylcysteine O-methyltransferase Ste14
MARQVGAHVTTTLDVVAMIEVIASWLSWVFPFFLARRRQPPDRKSVTAPEARRGIALQSIAFFLVWFRTIRSSHPPLLIAAMIIAPLSAGLAAWAVGHLGKQWRIQAGLYSDHELVRSGPYAYLRHPIYASMLGMLVATGLVMTWWPIVIAAAAIFIIGIEIRIRAEEKLLRSRFGESFEAYRASVPAYIPFVR